MSVEIRVPELPESVADATVGNWHKNVGEVVKSGELLVEIETDKVVLEVPASEDGVLLAILCERGSTVVSRQPLATLMPGIPTAVADHSLPSEPASEADILTPSVRRMLAEEGIDPAELVGSGRGGRITREDISRFLANRPKVAASAPPVAVVNPVRNDAAQEEGALREEKRVPMTRLRQRVAERLLDAKNTTAMLTTFNEVNMKPIMDIRKGYQERFEKRHSIKLGFMSFYVKAVTEALKRYPIVNASIDGADIVYHNYFDISIAVSTERGLVTPVLRDCDSMSLADIERGIKSLADKARDGKLTVDDLSGGNFTITNGGVFGSLMSTPIINPPQSAILGMHKIQDRPMAVDGQVVILPMMYLALSYDHRIIDGRDSVGFLVTVKELLEDPTRLLLDI
ncbi:MAG: 2-oxoglutarate dehydrogenase complex dihydrolipoyllysine-residue succinyltransferase [Aeromonadaceae bacterium]